MARDKVVVKKKSKNPDKDSAGGETIDRILNKRKAAATGVAPAKGGNQPKGAAGKAPAKGGAQGGKGAAAGKAQPKAQAKPKSKPSGDSYATVLDDLDFEEEEEINANLERNRALRNDGGESSLVDRKDKSKAERKREDKISRQLNEKFDGLLSEEAVIISESGKSFPSANESKEASAEQDCLRVESFSLSFKGNMLFSEAKLVLAAGHRYGLIGPNGSGKSTFLRNVAAKKLPGMDPAIDLLHVEQEVDGTDQLAIDAVLSADVKRTELLDEKTRLEEDLVQNTEQTDEEIKQNQARLDVVYSELRAIGSDSAPARAAKILSGLQFTPEMQRQATREFSGGWRMRIALARALFRQPSLLLLDEPTNHLDLHAVIWLEEYLRRWKKTLVIVSHDRDFLNSVVTRIVHINEKKLNAYRGDYDSFMNTFQTKKRTQEKISDKQTKAERELKKMLHGDASAGGKGKKGASKQMSAVQKKAKAQNLAKIQNEKVTVARDYRVNFEFPDPSHALEHPVIQINDVTFRYPKADDEAEGKLIFTDLNFSVDMDSRISLVGPNGSGKSTLLGLLFGKLAPTDGSVSIKKHLRIGYFTQHFVDQLDMEVSPAQHLQRKYPDIPYQQVRKALGSFGLEGKLHTRPIQTLSGGQKNRVVFASISLGNPDILFLDEPTNHLDVESIEALAEALENFHGGVVVVSHDARLIDAICNDIWIIGGGTVKTNYAGGIFDYRQSLIDALGDDDFE